MWQDLRTSNLGQGSRVSVLRTTTTTTTTTTTHPPPTTHHAPPTTHNGGATSPAGQHQRRRSILLGCGQEHMAMSIFEGLWGAYRSASTRVVVEALVGVPRPSWCPDSSESHPTLWADFRGRPDCCPFVAFLGSPGFLGPRFSPQIPPWSPSQPRS